MNVETTQVVHYSVAIVDDDPRLRTTLSMHLGEAVQPVSYPNFDVLEAKAPGGPVVLVVGPAFATIEGLSAIATFRDRRPAVAVVLVAAELSTALLQQAMRSGISDVL